MERLNKPVRSGWAALVILCCASWSARAELRSSSGSAGNEVASGSDAQQSQSSAPTGAAQGEQLSEIIVTAQKRSQSLQEVPISVTALSESTMQRADIHLTSDLPSVAPALTYSSGFMPGVSSFNIRGLGTYVYRIGVEPAISVVARRNPPGPPRRFCRGTGRHRKCGNPQWSSRHAVWAKRDGGCHQYHTSVTRGLAWRICRCQGDVWQGAR